MNILVLLKRTFDTEEKIVVENNQVSEDGVEFIINPYDEYAVEEGIKLRDEHGGEVTVLSVGPDDSEKVLRTALAMGADKAVLIDNESLEDEYAVSQVLAAYLKANEFDIILGGNVSVDNGAGQVAPRVAELLDIPQVTTITKLTVADGKATVERDVEGDLEVVETSLPALFTAQQGLNEPRYPSLPGIMKAKKKPLERLSAADLSVSADDLKPKTETSAIFLPPEKQAGRILEGETENQVNELVDLLRNEAKVI